MKCNEFRNHLLDLVNAEPSGEYGEHLRACAACAAELASFRRTLAVLDEWKAPADTSPYFYTRLHARLREEEARPAGWLAWLPKPALAVSLVVLMMAGIGLFEGGSKVTQPPLVSQQAVTIQPGTAVGDLQYLDKNHELLADFDLLDELNTQNP